MIEDDIKKLRQIWNRHIFVLFATIIGCIMLMIGNFVYDDTDAFNFFELMPLTYILTNIIFMLSFEYRSFKVSLLWIFYLFGCFKISDRKFSVTASEPRGRRGTALMTGAEIPSDIAKINVGDDTNNDQIDPDVESAPLVN